MKSLNFFVLPTLFCIIFIAACDRNKNQTQTAEEEQASVRTVNDMNGSPDRATENDSVWVIINHVRPGKRDVFEKFFHEIFFDSSSNLNADEQRLFRQTRILHPTQAEADGTYSYFLIMDPFIPGGDYHIRSIMMRMYQKEAAEKHLKMFDEAVIKQTSYKLIQSRH